MIYKESLLIKFLVTTLLLSIILKSYSQDSTVFNNSKNDTISIIGVGDIMMGTNFPSKIFLPPNDDCFQLMDSVTKELVDADVTFGNLEGCFSDSAVLVKRCKDTTKCYAFRMPEKYAACLKENGFDLFSLANNHSGDFGDEGKNTTMLLLDSLGIGYAGLIGKEYSIIEKDSVLYGLCAFSPNKGTTSIHDIVKAKELVGFLKDTVDIVIVSFHGGAEGAKYEHVPRKVEEFYGENRGDVYKFAHEMIDAGADIVFGHGPHVTRAIELYNERFICYSLGNFCTWGRFNLRGPNGLAPIMKVFIDKEGVFLKGKIIPVYQNGKNGVKIDEQSRIIYKLQLLTKQDFPETNLEIKDNGEIIRTQ